MNMIRQPFTKSGRSLVDWRCLSRHHTTGAATGTTNQFQNESKGTAYSDTGDNDGMYSSETETHFGFTNVSEKEKAQKVKTVFENVADAYDLMNDVMSGGIHRIWKDIFINRLSPGRHTKLIDVAGGTGDIAFRFLKYNKVACGTTMATPFNIPVTVFTPLETDLSKFTTDRPENEVEAMQQAAKTRLKSSEHPHSGPITRSVLVCDINPRMLEVGERRSKSILKTDQLNRIDWLEGDAENLHSIPDNSFDAYTIAFGIRNCVHIDKVLEEAYRVLRPGGRFMCLEFSHIENPALKWTYDQYSFQMIPVMGQVFAGDWDSYQYLVESIRKFPSQNQFQEMIEAAGFRFTRYENLSFGIAAIHTGFKITSS